MLIHVRAKDGPTIFLPIPTALACNRLTAGMAAKVMAQNGCTVTPDQMNALFRVIRRYKRAHPDWVAVEVQSSNGDEVIVKF